MRALVCKIDEMTCKAHRPRKYLKHTARQLIARKVFFEG